MTTDILISDVTFYRDNGGPLVWADHQAHEALPRIGGGSREGALLVQMLVDGDITVVHHDCMDRVMLERVISDLGEILEGLDAMYPAGQSRGRCLSYGDWGRCWDKAGHTADHSYPKPPADYAEVMGAEYDQTMT